MYHRHRGRILVPVLLAGLVGCGAGNGLNLGRVRGKVTIDGAPARAGFVTFQPDTSQQTTGNPAMSTITADGSYDLSTQDPGDGAIVGFHKVGIVVYDPEPIAEEPAADPQTAPREFLATKGQKVAAKKPRGAAKGAGKAEASGRTMKDRGGQTFRVLVPEELSNPATSGITVEVKRGSNAMNFAVRPDGSVDVN
jgi:hypothetical protein